MKITPKIQKKLDDVNHIYELTRQGFNLGAACITRDITVEKYHAMRKEMLSRGHLIYGKDDKPYCVDELLTKVEGMMKANDESYDEVDALIDTIMDTTDGDPIAEAVNDVLNLWIAKISGLLESDNTAARMTGELIGHCITDIQAVICCAEDEVTG